MEFTDITLREADNGYAIRGYNGLIKYFDEVHEQRLESLRAIERWVKYEILSELERQNYKGVFNATAL